MLVLDREKTEFLLDQCVKQRGEDFKYEREVDYADCKYVHGVTTETWNDEFEEYETTENPPEDYKPGCMVGLALIKGGIPMQAFIDLGINETDSYNALRKLELNDYLSFTEEAAGMLARAQTKQDNGDPWGVALKAALSEPRESEV